MNSFETGPITVKSGDKVQLPSGRAVMVAIWPGSDSAVPRKKSTVEAYIEGQFVGAVSVVDDTQHESLVPQTLTVLVPRSAKSGNLAFSGQNPGKVILTQFPLDD